jgi:hypothetical protein
MLLHDRGLWAHAPRMSFSLTPVSEKASPAIQPHRMLSLLPATYTYYMLRGETPRFPLLSLLSLPCLVGPRARRSTTSIIIIRALRKLVVVIE